MRLNWISHNYSEFDGYGRYNNRLIAALARRGVAVLPLLPGHARMPDWMRAGMGVDFSLPTLACLPPYCLPTLPEGHGSYTLLSMTEGSELPPGWGEIINGTQVDRVIVPCAWNARAFVAGGVTAPVHVSPGGTDPEEFPVQAAPDSYRPYTFLTLGDRGSRKGWGEVWDAFYKAFGTPEDTPDVRLVIKTRPAANRTLNLIAGADEADPRIRIWREDVPQAADIYRTAHCVALPSRGEGWGMPHREAAMLGLPVITLRYGGLDDGYIDRWSLPINGYRLGRIPEYDEHVAGLRAMADVDELAARMRECYDKPQIAQLRGLQAARWLRKHQTWDQAAAGLLGILEETHALPLTRAESEAVVCH